MFKTRRKLYLNENYTIDLVSALDQKRSQKQLNSDIKQIEKMLNFLQLTGTFSKTTPKKLNTYIKQLSAQLSTIKLKAEIDSKNVKSDINKALNNVSFKDIDALNIDENKTKLKLQKVIADTKSYVEKNPISIGINYENRRNKLDNDLTAYLNRNSKINESSVLLKESNKVRELISTINDKKSLSEATDSFRLFKSEVASTGYNSKSTSDKIKSMLGHVTKISSVFGVASVAVNSFTKSISELKEIDTLLTEISKANDKLSKSDLNKIGNDSFGIASQYGKKATNYLSGVQEASRAGYENAEAIAQLSVAAQGAGDMTDTLANKYLIATDKAYKFGGSVEKLTEVLDGSNYITNHNAVNMTELAESMSIVGSTAASFGVDVDETTAALGTMIATTQQSGSEVARAFKAILLNIRQVSDEEEGIDAEGLTKYEKACNALNVKLKETKNGVLSLRDPMEVLKELSVEYNKLEESDVRRTDLLSSIGGKLRSTQLDALLRQWDTYESMLQQYAEGTGSMAAEAEKTAKSWEGRLNSLSNSFTSFVNTVTSKDAVLGGIGFFDKMIQGAESFVDTFGTIPTVLTAINSSMVAMQKDYGITQLINPETKKFDVQGSIFGINFTAIKNQKKHFEEASQAIDKWNSSLKIGKTDIERFDESVVQNNAQLKEYLSTCSKDAQASLNGYKAYLQQTGQATEDLRLKTILLNTALTFLGSIAVQAVITGLYNLSQVSNNIANNAKDLGDSFKSASSDIESYKSRIEELYSTINDSNSSIEDVTNARKSLLSIQDELIDKFGTEKSVINDVTDAINGQADALDRLTNSKWQETKNEFNNGGFWNNAANFFQGKDNIQRMLDEYSEKTVSFKWADFADIDKLTDEMVAKLEDIGIDIKVNTDDLQGLRDFDSLIESISDTKGASLSITGNAEEIYNQLLALQNLIGNDDSFDKLYDKVESTADSYKDITDSYKDFYNQYILYEKILTENSDYANTFKDITDAYEEYKNAFASGDESKIKEVTENYAKVLTDATSTAIANSDTDVASYFESMYPELQSVVEGWKFNIAFEANADNLQSNVQSVLEKLRDESGRSLTTEEILGLNAENEQYQSLISIAHSYNMTLEEMIELLKERNLVSAMDYQGLVGLFGQEDVDKLSPEDLEIAYTIKNVGSITFDDLQAEIQKLKNSADETEIKTFDQAWADSFTSEDDAVKELGNSLLELAEQGRLTIETFNEADSTDYFKNLEISADEAVAKINRLVDESKQLSSMSSQISSMADALGTKQEDGFVSADTLSGFDVEVRGLDSWDRFQEVLGSTTSSYEECQEAANALATEWVNSSDFLAQLTEQNREYYATQLEAMGIENYEEVITYAQALNEAKETLAQSSLMLGEATQDEIESLIAEGQYSELTANMILALYDAKVAEQAVTIDSSEDCENLIALAGDTDRTSKSIELLIQLMEIYTGLENNVYGKNNEARAKALAKVDSIKKELEAIANGETAKMEIEPTVKLGNRGKSSAKSAGKEAGKSYKDGLKEELSDLESVISGVTGKIDKQISSIKTQKEEAVAAIDAQIDALNEQKSALEAQKKALEEERDARIEIIEQQKKQLELAIKAIDKQIKDKEKVIESINDEINAMKDANEQRKLQINLQKEQYELERLQNQRTILLYSEEKGMHYVTDTKGIRDQKQKVDDAKLEIEIANKQKQIDLIEKEIDLLNEKKDAINEQIDMLDEQIDQIKEFYEEQIKAIDKQIDAIDKQVEALEKQREETEKYYELLIENLEKSKSKYEELTEIVGEAELSAALKQLGIDEEALLNGSEEEFEKLKNAYLDIVFKLNEGNDEVLNSLRELSGYEGTAPALLSDSNSELDTMNGKLDESNQSVGNVNSSLGETASTTSEVASNVSDLTSNLFETNTLISDEQTAFETLKQTIDEVITSINEKITAIQEEQNTVETATNEEMANFLLLKEKILEVKESFDSISDTVTTLDTMPINNLTTAFQLLYDQLLLVSDTLGVGMEGQEEGTVSSITSAIQALNNISFEEGIITQFTNLKTAIDEVTSAIGGGSESSGGEGQGGSSGSGGESGGKGSESEGGGNSLTGAITQMGETANEVIGKPDAEGDGTVIGEFGSMKKSVNDVTSAIGSGDSEGGEGGSGGEGESDNLIGSIVNLGETTQEEMGESGGDGIIGKFEEFRDVVGEANGHVTGISAGLEDIDGKEVECTIKVNIITTGGLPAGLAHSTGTALDTMKLESADYNAKYGNAHVEGTALVSGNWAVQSDESDSLVGEEGYEIVVRNGRFFTVGNTGAEMFKIKRGDIVFNHEQSVNLLKNGHISGRGKAYADGTVGGGKILTPDGHILRPLQPGDRGWDLMQAFQPLVDKMLKGEETIVSNAVFEGQKQFEKWTKEITNNTAISNVTNKNVQPSISIGDIHVTCPGVTSQEVMKELGNALDKQIGHLSQRALQEQPRRY